MKSVPNLRGLHANPSTAIPKEAAKIRTWQWMLFIALSGFPFGKTYFSGNMQNSVIDLTTAIVEGRTCTIDPYHQNTPDAAFRDGHYYSGMAPGASFLAVPIYFAAKAALKVGI